MAPRRVAAAAGASAGSVYERFTDKDGLVRAVQHDVLDRVDDDLRAAFAELEEAEAPVADLIAAAVRILAEQTVRHGTVMGPLILRAAADVSLRERGNATSALAEELFTALLLSLSGELSCPRPATAVPVTFRSIFGIAMWQVMFGPDAGLRHQISEDELLHGLITQCRAHLLPAGDIGRSGR